MNTPITLHRDAAFHVWIILLVTLVALGASSSRSQPSDGVSSRSLLCTLRAVDPESRLIVVLTGVGHSIRAVRMQVAPTCRVQVSRRLVDLRDLRAGQVARVGYAMAPPKAATPREIALSIEVTSEVNGGTR